MLRSIGFFLFSLVMIVPLTVLAQPPIGADSGLGDLVNVVADSVKSGNWNLVVSAVIMILVWVGTRTPLVNTLVKGEARVWVAMALGLLGAIVTNFISGGDWITAIVSGLTTGAAAAGLWSALGKRMAPAAPEASSAADSADGQ